MNRRHPVELTDTSRVYLSHEDLLRISSEQLKNRITGLIQQAPLSRTETTEVARQTRLVYNRELARRARATQKEYTQSLQAENQWLRDQLKTLTTEYQRQLEEVLEHPLLCIQCNHPLLRDRQDPLELSSASTDYFHSDSETLSL